MLNLFLRTIFLYLFLLFILRLTGKRQVADLEPFDLIVTLVIADVGSNAISDTNIPLLYSIVPIIGLYLVQQLIARLCLKSAAIRHFICGTPQALIKGGVLQKPVMRRTNYTIRDTVEHLRQKDVFDFGEVENAILETNGSLSVQKKPAFDAPTKQDLNIKTKPESLPHIILAEGQYDEEALRASGFDRTTVDRLLQKRQLTKQDVFWVQVSSDGSLLLQTDDAHGQKLLRIDAEGRKA